MPGTIDREKEDEPVLSPERAEARFKIETALLEGDEELFRDGEAFAAAYAQGVIDDVIGHVKSGKEARLFLCHREGELIAAKVYRDPTDEAMRPVTRSRRDRRVLDDPTHHRLDDARLVAHEFEVLQLLHDAGVTVPTPLAQVGPILFMRYLGDEDGAAPRLKDAPVSTAEAQSAFEQLTADLELMIGEEIVHGDLSAFNLLWWESRCWLIDFPQATNADPSQESFDLWSRDIRNVCAFFRSRGVQVDAAEMAARLWEQALPVSYPFRVR